MQLTKEGYPDRVCDYCQLQLNTFHAFVRKAKNTSAQFEKRLKKLKQCDGNSEQHSEIETEPDQEQEQEQEQEGKSTNSEMIAADDMEFELEISNDDELNEMEYIVNKKEIRLIGKNGEEVIDIDETEVEGMYWSDWNVGNNFFLNENFRFMQTNTPLSTWTQNIWTHTTMRLHKMTESNSLVVDISVKKQINRPNPAIHE